MTSKNTVNVHATCIVIAKAGKAFGAPASAGVLFLGKSGAGKSDLALRLIARGAKLVSDDRTDLFVENGKLFARAPATIKGLIEARGIGIVAVPHAAKARIALAVSLERPKSRLPPREYYKAPFDLSAAVPLITRALRGIGARENHSRRRGLRGKTVSRESSLMIGIVLVTHGRLAQEFISAMEHMVGPQTHLRAVCIGPEDDIERRQREIAAAAKSVDSGKGVVVATDMFGGTPCNLALTLLERGKIEVLAGVNLPSLIKLVDVRSRLPLDQAVKEAIDAGRKYMRAGSVDLVGGAA